MTSKVLHAIELHYGRNATSINYRRLKLIKLAN